MGAQSCSLLKWPGGNRRWSLGGLRRSSRVLRSTGFSAPGLFCSDIYEDQVALHKALGLGVVGRGEKWSRKSNATPGLFG